MKKKKLKNKWTGRIVWTLIALTAVLFLGWLTRYLLRFSLYDEYKDYLTDYVYEKGSEFLPIQESEPDVDKMVLVAENEYLKLYTDTSTAYVAVFDKRNGTTVYSNPLNADEDSVATATNLNYLKSQLIVDYFNLSRTPGAYDSYSMAVERGQIRAESIENGIRYLYDIGDKSNATGIVPLYLSQEKLDEIVGKLSASDGKYVSARYRTGENEYLELNESARKGPSQLRKLNKFFEEAGFTQEDYNEQMMASNVEGAVPISFEIPLEYRLDGDSVVASIPMSGVKEFGGGKIFRIQMLRYFGAAGLEEEGYIVVPNGSGSLIYFNNGKETTEQYSQYIYGIDPLTADYTVLENTEPNRLPVFGLCRENSSILGCVESGDTMALLTAGVSGKFNEYNYCYATYTLRGYDKLSMFGNTGSDAELPIVETNFYNEELKVRYSLLTEEDTGYAGIANYYRRKLKDRDILQPIEEEEEIPFYYDVVAGVKKSAYFLGAQYLSVNPVSTFEEAEWISDDLKERGISNQVMNLQGWFNGGYYHDVADRIHVIGKLGGKKGLEELNASVRENGGRMYVDTAFQKVSFLSRRYEYAYETSRYYGAGYIAYLGQVNPGNLRQTSSLGYSETMYHLLSPKFLPRYVGRFSEKIVGYDVDGISLRDLGDVLQSDKKRTNVINREEAKDVVEAQFSVLADTGKNLMVQGGNAYAFPYVRDIMNAPVSSNDFFIIDEEIPLYEMIIHGCISYCGEPLNLSDTFDVHQSALALIERGASPHFIFTYQSSNELKETGLNRYYSTCYSNWRADAAAVYEEVNMALQKVASAEIIDYWRIAEGVSAVAYSNGITIYVNKTDESVIADGITIPANDYLVEGGDSFD